MGGMTVQETRRGEAGAERVQMGGKTMQSQKGPGVPNVLGVGCVAGGGL